MLSERALAALGESASFFQYQQGEGAWPRGSGGYRNAEPYRGASRFDREVALWQPGNHSANFEILLGKAISDARAKDAYRNDSFVQNGVAIHKDSIVGSMYMLNSKPNRRALGLHTAANDAWETEFQEEVEALWTVSAESEDCWLDASRSLPFTGLVRLAVGIFSSVGEVLASAEWIKDKARPFRTAVNLVDVDRLANPIGEPESSTYTRGIKRDAFGAPIAFNICNAYPAEWLASLNTDAFTYTEVPVRTSWGRPQIIYLKDAWRADQARGISALVSALKEWKMTKGFRDITLQNAVTNATYAASIESEFPDEAFASLGAGTPGDAGEIINNYATAYLSAIDDYTGGGKSALTLDGVKVPHFFPGTKLQLRPAGTPGGVGTSFEDSLLRYLSAALGVSFEELSKNYTNTNYSSIRAAMNSVGKGMAARKRLIADRFASITYRLWFEEMANARRFTTLTDSMPGIYVGQNLAAYTDCEWIGAARGQIDELKETQAAMLRMTTGLTTLEWEAGRLGLDWRAIIRQQAREQAARQQAGLPVIIGTSQNQANALSGAPESGPTGKTNAGEESDDEGDNPSKQDG